MKSLILTGSLCLSLLSWNCSAQNISFDIESQQQNENHSIHPTLFLPLNNTKYQVISFISLKTEHKRNQTPNYQSQGYGLGLSYQAAPWLNSQLVIQENYSRSSHESKLNIEVGF